MDLVKDGGHVYVITKDIRDFGVMPLTPANGAPIALKVPAPLACYWLGRSELEPDADLAEGE